MKRINALLISLSVASLFLLQSHHSDATTPPNSTPELASAAYTTTTGQKLAQAKTKRAVLALDSEGLRVVNPANGTTRLLAFGMKETDVATIITNIRGKMVERGKNQECGAGPLGFTRWGGGLTLWFEKERFAGWFVDGRQQNAANKLTTIAGIGTGSTRAQLNKVYTTKVFQSTLGTEFSAGQLGGLLSGTKPSDRVTSLWSGVTCLFR